MTRQIEHYGGPYGTARTHSDYYGFRTGNNYYGNDPAVSSRSSSGGNSSSGYNSGYDNYQSSANSQAQDQYVASERRGQSQYDAEQAMRQRQYDAQLGSTRDYANALNQQYGARYDAQLGAAGHLADRGQIQQARGEYMPAYNFANEWMNTGGISDQQGTQMETANYMDILGTARASAQDLTSGLAARGLGGNVGAAAAMNQGGQFAASGSRARTRSDIIQQRNTNRMNAAQLSGQIGGQLAGLDTQVTYDQANSRMNALQPQAAYYQTPGGWDTSASGWNTNWNDNAGSGQYQQPGYSSTTPSGSYNSQTGYSANENSNWDPYAADRRAGRRYYAMGG